MVQSLGVLLALLKSLLWSNTAPDRPNIDGEVAIVGYNSVANGAGERSQGGHGGNNSRREMHYAEGCFKLQERWNDILNEIENLEAVENDSNEQDRSSLIYLF